MKEKNAANPDEMFLIRFETKMIRVNGSLLLLIICVLCCISCSKNTNYLEKAIKGDAIVCPLIYAEDSVIIMISTTSLNMVNEVDRLTSHNAVAVLENALKNKLPIQVSNEFYKEHIKDQIYTDSVMNVTYQKKSIKGLMMEYFRNDGVSILWKAEPMFPIDRDAPGKTHNGTDNIGYIAYLLSRHDIYLRYLWIDEDGVLMLVMAEEFSNIDVLK